MWVAGTVELVGLAAFSNQNLAHSSRTVFFVCCCCLFCLGCFLYMVASICVPSRILTGWIREPKKKKTKKKKRDKKRIFWPLPSTNTANMFQVCRWIWIVAIFNGQVPVGALTMYSRREKSNFNNKNTQIKPVVGRLCTSLHWYSVLVLLRENKALILLLPIFVAFFFLSNKFQEKTFFIID